MLGPYASIIQQAQRNGYVLPMYSRGEEKCLAGEEHKRRDEQPNIQIKPCGISQGSPCLHPLEHVSEWYSVQNSLLIQRQPCTQATSSNEGQIYVSFKSQPLHPALLQNQCSTMQCSMSKSDENSQLAKENNGMLARAAGSFDCPGNRLVHTE